MFLGACFSRQLTLLGSLRPRLRSLLVSAVLAVSGLLPGQHARGEHAPPLIQRELVIQASEIVVAAPLDPLKLDHKHVEFRVADVLKGDQLKVGMLIGLDMSLYHLAPPFPSGRQPKKPAPRCTRAVLFLKPAGDRPASGRFHLVFTGVRYLTADKQVLAPWQVQPGGYYYFRPEGKTDWKKLIRGVKNDIRDISAVFQAKSIDDAAARNQALLLWIEQHHKDFAGHTSRRPGRDEAGWGSLERTVFDWVLDSCRPADGWRALRMHHETPSAATYPQWHNGCFMTVEGRRFLLDIAIDPLRTLPDRQHALSYLGGSLWPVSHPPQSILSVAEQAVLIDTVMPLLNHEDQGIRSRAAEVLSYAFPPEWATGKYRDKAPTLSALVDAYRAEAPGVARNAMAIAVRAVGGEQAWQSVSGNHAGLLVTLIGSGTAREVNGKEVLHIGIRRPPWRKQPEIRGRPKLVLERLSADGAVIDRMVQQLPPSPFNYEPAGPRPFLSAHSEVAELPTASLAEGTWRLSLEGTAGNGKNYQWRSEPCLVELKR